MAEKLQIQNLWCKLDGFDPFPVAYVAGRDKCVYDNCFYVAELDSSVHKLLVLCSEGCGLQHTHTIIGDRRVGVEIKSTSEGKFEVISVIYFIRLIF